MGEGMENDEQIIPYIHAANIACGYHAGDATTMLKTIEACVKNGVQFGAHISFYDRENFGRTEMKLDEEDLYELVMQQLIIFDEIAGSFDVKPSHVKPHGALYNMSARDAKIATTIAKAVKDFDPSLVLYGLSGSESIKQAKAIGLNTSSEVFADRTYQDDGSLTPRYQPNALIDSVDAVLKQVLQMKNDGTVTTVSGKKIPIVAETLCIHGDGVHALEFAKAISQAVMKN